MDKYAERIALRSLSFRDGRERAPDKLGPDRSTNENSIPLAPDGAKNTYKINKCINMSD